MITLEHTSWLQGFNAEFFYVGVDTLKYYRNKCSNKLVIVIQFEMMYRQYGISDDIIKFLHDSFAILFSLRKSQIATWLSANVVERYWVRFRALPWDFTPVNNYWMVCKDWELVCFHVLCPCSRVCCLRRRLCRP